MKEVTITFCVEYSGIRSNQISKTTQMSEDLYHALNLDLERTGGQTLALWIQNNMIATVLEQAMPSGAWRIVSPSISRKGW